MHIMCTVCACLYIGIPRSYGGDPSRADRACAHKFRHEFRCARTNSLGRFFTAHQFTDPAVLLLKPVPRTRCASHGPGRYSRHSRSHPLRVPRLRPVSTAHPFTHRFAVARPAASGPAFTALLCDSRSHPLCVARGLGRFSHRYTVGTLERGEEKKEGKRRYNIRPRTEVNAKPPSLAVEGPPAPRAGEP